MVFRFLFILFLFTTVFGEEKAQTVFGGISTSSAYFGLGVKPTYVRDQFSVMVGVHTGALLNDKIRLGVAFYTLANMVSVPTDSVRNLRMSYYGFECNYLFFPRNVVHASLSTFIGGGGLVYHNPKYYNYFAGWPYRRHDVDAIFVFEPLANVEINLTDFLGLELGAGYRLVAGTTLKGLANEDLRGFTTSIAVDFRAF